MYQNRIVFTRFHGDGKEMFNDIYAVDPDGKNETRLTMNPGPDGEYHDHACPRYNRDKSMLAFVSTKNNENKLYNIFLLDLAGKKTAQVTSGNFDIRSVDWSPDDSQLVFSCRDEQGLQQVHIVNMDGTGFTKLTNGPSENMNPLWSPRGDWIVFVEFPPAGKSSHILLMDPRSRTTVKVTTDEVEHSNPSWSPDGAWIIYRCDMDTPHLRRMNVDTREMVPMEPPARGADSSPIWSGSGIVFSSNCDWEGAESLFNLYTVSLEGEQIQRLTNTQTYDYCGDW